MAFRNLPFPGRISAGGDSTPVLQVDISRSASGNEKRVSRRGVALHTFTAPLNIRTLDDIYEVKKHFLIVGGPLYSFPYKDLLDFKSVAPEVTNIPSNLDCLVGTGDGSTATFQLVKTYPESGFFYTRPIYLPVQGTVLISVAGVAKTETTHWTMNYTTGILTFTGGNIPTSGQLIKAGFEFNCKVRYATNNIQAVAEAYRAGSIPSLTLIEVLD